MQRFVISIEETVVQEFSVDANTEKDAIDIAIRKYKSKEFMLESGEVQYKQLAVVSPVKEEIEWFEF